MKYFLGTNKKNTNTMQKFSKKTNQVEKP